MKNAQERNLFDEVGKESEKAIMMNEDNLKLNPRGVFNPKKNIIT